MKNNLFIQPIANILLTEHCNQNCPFCFANQEMTQASKKEISVKDFNLILKKYKEARIVRAAFAGGEPTLHSQFARLIDLGLKQFIQIHINSNGIFSEKIRNIFLDNPFRFHLHFNVSTPGFLFNKNIQRQVLQNIESLAKKIPTSLVITSHFMHTADALTKLKAFTPKLCKSLSIRLGVEGVTAGQKNYATIDDFPKIGNNFFTVYRYVKETLKPKSVTFGKSIVPCMFTASQLKELKREGLMEEYVCHPKSEGRVFTVTPDMDTFRCYPLSTTKIRHKIGLKTNFDTLARKIEGEQKILEKKLVLPKCKTCPFFGYGMGKCPGPCLAFRINALSPSK